MLAGVVAKRHASSFGLRGTFAWRAASRIAAAMTPTRPSARVREMRFVLKKRSSARFCTSRFMPSAWHERWMRRIASLRVRSWYADPETQWCCRMMP